MSIKAFFKWNLPATILIMAAIIIGSAGTAYGNYLLTPMANALKANNNSQFIMWIVATILFNIVGRFLQFIASYAFTIQQEHYTHDLRKRIVQNYYTDKNAGQLKVSSMQNRLTNDLKLLNQQYLNPVYNITLSTADLIFSIYFVLTFNYILLILILVLAFIMMILPGLVQGKLHQAIDRVSSSLATLVEDSSLLYDSLLWVEKYNRFEKYHDSFQSGSKKLDVPIDQIKLSHVSFTYPFSNEEILHDINFSINKGEKIAIVGENGSGKSTLIKLLMRFYDPSKGKIDLNGINLKDYDIKTYRNNLSATFQDYSKFKFSLFENVSVFRPGDDNKVKNALGDAGLSNLLNDKDINLNTVLSKEFANGVELSGGQWQKIALARDIYSDAQVEFLDEPTAAIDAKSENEIYEHFLAKNKNKTIVFVTHRLSAVKYADKILFLQNGKVQGFDSHENLMQTNADYRNMYNLQKEAYI